jgi:hypothetical protein
VINDSYLCRKKSLTPVSWYQYEGAGHSAYRVLTPEQTLELADELGDHSILHLNPVLAGIDPKYAEEMLGLNEQTVRPDLKRRSLRR